MVNRTVVEDKINATWGLLRSVIHSFPWHRESWSLVLGTRLTRLARLLYVQGLSFPLNYWWGEGSLVLKIHSVTEDGLILIPCLSRLESLLPGGNAG